MVIFVADYFQAGRFKHYEILVRQPMVISPSNEEIPRWPIRELKFFLSNKKKILKADIFNAKLFELKLPEVPRMSKIIKPTDSIFDNSFYFPDYTFISASLPRYVSQRLLKFVVSASSLDEASNVIQFKLDQLNKFAAADLPRIFDEGAFSQWYKSAKILRVKEVASPKRYELAFLLFLVIGTYLLNEIGFIEKILSKKFSTPKIIFIFSFALLLGLGISYFKGIPVFSSEVVNVLRGTNDSLDQEDVSYYLLTEKYPNGIVVETQTDINTQKLALYLKSFKTASLPQLVSEVRQKVFVLFENHDSFNFNEYKNSNPAMVPASGKMSFLHQLGIVRVIFLFCLCGSLFLLIGSGTMLMRRKGE